MFSFRINSNYGEVGNARARDRGRFSWIDDSRANGAVSATADKMNQRIYSRFLMRTGVGSSPERRRLRVRSRGTQLFIDPGRQ
jgi:hypothetical protein